MILGCTLRPEKRRKDGILYFNTGDWTDHWTALVEHTDSRLGLLWWPERIEKQQAAVETVQSAAAVTAPQPNRQALSHLWAQRKPATSMRRQVRRRAAPWIASQPQALPSCLLLSRPVRLCEFGFSSDVTALWWTAESYGVPVEVLQCARLRPMRVRRRL